MTVDFGRLLPQFLSEASDQLDRLNQHVLFLERDPSAREHLDEVFRLAHSIKGSAASFGFVETAGVAHAFEGYLQRIRRGQLSLATPTVDVLLAALDALRVLLDHEARGRGADEDPEASLTRVQEARAVLPRLSAEPAAGPRQAAAEVEEEFPPLAAVQRAMEHLGQGAPAFVVRLAFEAGAAMLGVRAYLLFSNLERLGTVLATKPARERFGTHESHQQLELLIALRGPAGRTELEDACRIDQVLEAKVEPFPPVEASEPSAAAPAPAPPAPPAARGERGRSPVALGSTERLLRIDLAKVDELLYLASELSTLRNKLGAVVTPLLPALGARSARALEELLDKQEQLLGHLRDDIMHLRMVPVRQLFQRFPRLVRDLAANLGKAVTLEMAGEDTALDKKLVDRLGDPLVHLLRNAVDHGIEPPEERRRAGKAEAGTVRIVAGAVGHAIRIAIEDDGRGVDAAAVRRRALDAGVADGPQVAAMNDQEVLGFLFLPGFSTREQVTEVSGRGIGLDVVRQELLRLNGSVTMESTPGQGCRFVLQVPLTLAVTSVVLVRTGDETYALPVTNVRGTLQGSADAIMTVEGRGRFLPVDGRPVPFFGLGELLGGGAPPASPAPLNLVHVTVAEGEAVVMVDGFVGQEDMVIKSLAEHWRDAPLISGAALLADGRVVLILDLPAVVGRRLHAGAEGRVAVQ